MPTALVTVQMNVVLTSLSTEWMISWGPWATAEAGKTPAVLEGGGGGVTGGGHQGSTGLVPDDTDFNIQAPGT